MPRNPRIFISYRREDSQAITQLIDFRLRQTFGQRSVFIDVDSIPPGVDFRTHISDSIARCNVLLAIIGEEWLNASKLDGATETRRLDDPRDFVHVEIATALEQGITVVPVLVGKNNMPSASALPEALEKLAYCNSVTVRPGVDFHDQVNRLIRALRHQPDKKSSRRRIPLVGAMVSLVAVTALIAVGAVQYFRTSDREPIAPADGGPAIAVAQPKPTAIHDPPLDRLTLQTLPGLKGGRWWFDEFPCLTPQMRSALNTSDFPSLHIVGTSTPPAPNSNLGTGAIAFLLRPNISEVYEHLRQRVARQAAPVEFEPLAVADWNAKDSQLRKTDIEQMLVALKKAEQRAPVIHTSALLLQEQMKITGKSDPRIAEAYQKAITQYEQETARDPGTLGLAALCHADFARFKVVLGKNPEAIVECRLARRVFSRFTPPLPVPTLFDVDVLCAQAAAARMAGDWNEGESCLSQAKAALARLDDDHPLKAYVYERTAAYYADRWRSRTAEKYYQEAARLRLHPTMPSDGTMPAFWARHGAALCKRLQGLAADQEYAAINVEVKTGINKSKSELQRIDLYHGRVNNLERSADAHFFAADPTRLIAALADPRKIPAAQADRLELAAASALLEDARVDCRNLRERFTPAQLAVYETRFRAKQVIVESLRGELDRATKSHARLEQAEKKVAGDLYDSHLRIAKQAAGGCLQLAKALSTSQAAGPSLPGGGDKPRMLADLCLQQSSPEHLESLNRDDIELLMLCSALSVRAASARPALADAEDPEVLMRYVRHVRRVSENEALAYLRRYFDIGIDAELRRPQPDIDRVVDWVMEGRFGVPVRPILPKTADAKSVLVFHFGKTSGFALLSADGSRNWRAVPLAFGCECRGDKQQWKLPEELKAEIQRLPRPVETWYSDRITQLRNEDWTWGDRDVYRLVEE